VALQKYTEGLFETRDIDVRLGTAVTGIEDFIGDGYRYPGRRAVFSDGDTLEFGTMVWSGKFRFKLSRDGSLASNTLSGD
jgi:hypothetical protein